MKLFRNPHQDTSVPKKYAIASTALVLLGSLLSVSACHTAKSDTTASPSAGVVEPGAYPVTIKHRFGETTISSLPKRIVIYGLNEQDFFLSLGVVPVADSKFLDYGPGEIGPWARDALHGATPPTIIDPSDNNYKEKIASLHPDLIVALYSDIDDKTYNSLKEIAPVVAPRAEDGDFITPWQQELTTVGQIVGQPHKAQEILNSVEQQLADFRTKHPQYAHKTAVVAGEDGNQLSILSVKDPRGAFLKAIGFSQRPEIAKLSGNTFYTDVSWERSDLLNVDLLFWQTENDVRTEQQKLLNTSQFSAVTPIKEHHLILLNNASDDHYAMTEGSPLSITWELNRIGKIIDPALQGHIQQVK